MATILKFPLKIQDQQTLKLPGGTRFLSVQYQNDVLCLWAFVQPAVSPMVRTIRIVGTGHDVETDFMNRHTYIGTSQSADGLVWHVFEEISKNGTFPTVSANAGFA